MRFSLFTVVPLVGLFLGASASPVSNTGLEKRQESSAYDIVSSLYTEVQQYTGQINSTAASLNADSTAADNATAAASFQSAVESITAAVNSAQGQVAVLSPAILKRAALEARQTDDTNALASLVENLLLDVSGALNNVIGTLGLTALGGALAPLVSSLSGLLASLEVVVNNLLALVQQLLDGLLTGLSVGLAGLVL